MSNATAAHVSRVLRARHARSTSMSGRVRGYRSESEGFTARQAGTSVVIVEHHTGRAAVRIDAEAAAVRDAALARYADTLTAAGFTATVVAPNGQSAFNRVLRVTR